MNCNKTKTIAFIGVDGAGKSTIITKVAGSLGKGSKVQYMGNRDFEDKRIEQLAKPGFSKIDSLKRKYYSYKCFRQRYYSNIGHYEFLLFDRYVDELYLSQGGIIRLLYYIFYNLLFPKPQMYIYLHCPIEESLRRKDDISDKAKFAQRKSEYDAIYLNKKKCLCINTFDNTIDETIEKIKAFINDR